MQDWKRHRQLLQRVLYPNALILVLLLLGSVIGLTAVFTRSLEETAFAYVVYPLSAYTTVAAVLRSLILLKKGSLLLHKNALFHRYRTEQDFKTRLSLRLSLGVTLVYGSYKSFLGIYYRSPWFGSMAFYYIVLGMVRFSLLRHLRGEQTDPIQGFRNYRFCGYLLLVLTAALGFMSFYTIYEGKAAEYPGHIIYGAAGFTFYNLTMAIVNLVRNRKRNNPIYFASKVLALATALVSLFFLQASMFAVFGDGSPWQKGMTMGTGAVVFLLIAGMALRMIWTGHRSIAALSARQAEAKP